MLFYAEKKRYTDLKGAKWRKGAIYLTYIVFVFLVHTLYTANVNLPLL